MRNRDIDHTIIDVFEANNRRGVGISNTISMSKTIKIIASRKNRIEKGIRALWFGSNPHSKGEDFSRSFSVRIVSRSDREKMMIGSAIATIDDVISMYIV
jgi:hypothetical protein